MKGLFYQKNMLTASDYTTGMHFYLLQSLFFSSKQITWDWFSISKYTYIYFT